jgi:hypothetical protein
MDKKSKIFFVVFFLLIVGSVGVTYYRYFIVRDYMITAQASCDPFTEACFVYVCDPTAEECTGDPEQDTSYYKNITRNAKNIPLCNPSDEDCTALTCPPGEADCTLTLCDPDTVPDGIVCNDPATYTSLHPEEDAVVPVEDTGESIPSPAIPADTAAEQTP